MAVTFVQEGKAIDYTPSSAVAAGDVVVQGDLVGVTRTPIPAGTPGSLAVSGVFDFPKATSAGSAITVARRSFGTPPISRPRPTMRPGPTSIWARPRRPLPTRTRRYRSD